MDYVTDNNAAIKEKAEYYKKINQISRRTLESEKEAIIEIYNLRYEKAKKQADAWYELQKNVVDKYQSLITIANQEEFEDRKEKLAQYYEEKLAAEEAAFAKASGRRNVSDLTKAEKERIKKAVKAEEDLKMKSLEKQFKQSQKLQKRAQVDEAATKNRETAIKEATENLFFDKDKSASERRRAFKELTSDENGKFNKWAALSSLTSVFSDIASKLEEAIDKVASTKTEIDTRLQGSKNSTVDGSYWDKMGQDITRLAAVSPLVKQEDIVEKLKGLVNKGISYNVEQRAFLDSISGKIATTFESTDASLIKLVRIQQQDTTAARLGMESALTAFLNNMYETTEYMSGVAADIRANLYEASALMSAIDATAFEYQVQKWMGSLYSVGMSQGSVGAISTALGKIASGQIGGLTSDGTGNLMIMAANNAGVSITDALTQGLDESKTNKLLRGAVEYLSDLYDEFSDNKVVQQQIAAVYGVTASDLKAAKNLSRSTSNVSSNALNYGGMLAQLNNMANSMYSRTSIGEMLNNSLANFKYTAAAGIANNPVLYSVYKMANVLKALTGGINFSLPMYMGTGLPTTFNVADLMLTGTLGLGLLGGLGSSLFSASGGGLSGSGMLKQLGIGSGITTVSRGTGSGLLTTRMSTSDSGSMVGNSSGDDIANKTMNDTAAENTVSADESGSATIDTVNSNLVMLYDLTQKIHDLLESVHSGDAIIVMPSPGTVWSN